MTKTIEKTTAGDYIILNHDTQEVIFGVHWKNVKIILI